MQAGDRVSARVDVEGRTVRLHLRNLTHATSATGHTGTISDPLWAATAIDLAADGAQLGGPPGRENADRASASTGALSASGGSFTVTAT